jgi:ribosome-binding protein aMBF1 (putative translation factor)
MDNTNSGRFTRPLTSDERDRLQRQRALVEAELPDLAARDQMRKDAQEETTLSGELRRAIHASDLSLADLAERIGVTAALLDEFLTGERTLRSDVMDRLALLLGCSLQQTS